MGGSSPPVGSAIGVSVARHRSLVSLLLAGLRRQVSARTHTYMFIWVGLEMIRHAGIHYILVKFGKCNSVIMYWNAYMLVNDYLRVHELEHRFLLD